MANLDINSPPSLVVLAPRASTVSLGDGSGQALEDINTTILPHGALCWANDALSAGLYQFDRNSTAAAAGTSIIVPASGPGRWFLLQPGGSSQNPNFDMVVTLIRTPFAQTGAQSTWSPVVSQASQFSGLGSSAGIWSVNTSTGVLTYHGPNAKPYLATVSSTVTPSTANARTILQTVDQNNTLRTTTTVDQSAQGVLTGATTASFAAITSSKPLFLSAGDVINPVWQDVGTAEALNIQLMTMSLKAIN